jgi:ankyrin repeat protein
MKTIQKKKVVLAALTTLALGVAVMYTRKAIAITPDENTLLQAAGSGDTARVSTLIRQGVNVNARDQQGNTPLHNAAENDHAAVATLLLQNRANAGLENRAGQTPGEVARQHGHHALANTLTQANH